MKPSITVVSLGPGDPGLLTTQSADALRHARRLILRTDRHRAAAWLREQGVAYTSFDDYYDRYDDFDAMHRAMAEALWREAEKTHVTYAVIDAAHDASLRALRAILPAEGRLEVLPGLSMADRCLAALPERFAHGGSLRIIPAVDWNTTAPDPSMPLLITELWNPALAGDVKLWLADLYDDEMPVAFFPGSAQLNRRPVVLPLAELDRQHTYDHTVCVYVPAAGLRERRRYCLADLLAIMRILRGPDGCPWDREQTHETLRKYLIEEAYEAAGAIDEGDPDHLADELGDVLLQIVFHADIARDHGAFTISDVTTAVCRKMIYRHAHIFGSDRCDTAEEVAANWEKLKMAEKGLASASAALADVSRGLPALMRAAKVQKKAARVGFDWNNALDALPKVHEEADELKAELDARRDPDEEMGDLLFSCVNVARLCGVEPEEALGRATQKFIDRFTAMENAIISDGKSLEGLTLSEMDVYWDSVKHARDGM